MQLSTGRIIPLAEKSSFSSIPSAGPELGSMIFVERKENLSKKIAAVLAGFSSRIGAGNQGDHSKLE